MISEAGFLSVTKSIFSYRMHTHTYTHKHNYQGRQSSVSTYCNNILPGGESKSMCAICVWEERQNEVTLEQQFHRQKKTESKSLTF